MFSRFKKTSTAPKAVPTGFNTTNGTGDHLALRTDWAGPRSETWWRDFHLSAQHLSNGDVGVFIGLAEMRRKGETAVSLATKTSTNCDLFGRFSQFGLTKIVPGDLPGPLKESGIQWSLAGGDPSFLIGALSDLRGVDVDKTDWMERMGAMAAMERTVAQLSGKGHDMMTSVFSNRQNTMQIAQGVNLWDFFASSLVAGLAEHVGIDQAESQALGTTVHNIRTTALGCIVVSAMLEQENVKPMH